MTLSSTQPLFTPVKMGDVIANVEMTPERANRLIAAGPVDSVAFARPYIANPDLARTNRSYRRQINCCQGER